MCLFKWWCFAFLPWWSTILAKLYFLSRRFQNKFHHFILVSIRNHQIIKKKSKQSFASNLNILFTGSHPSLGVLPQRGDYIHYTDAYVFPMFPIHHQRLTTEAWRLIRWKPISWRWPSSTVIISPPSCNGRWAKSKVMILEVLGLGWFIDDLCFFWKRDMGWDLLEGFLGMERKAIECRSAYR